MDLTYLEFISKIPHYFGCIADKLDHGIVEPSLGSCFAAYILASDLWTG